jgi:hypothetical protein
VANENLIFDIHPFANEGVTGDLAVFPDGGAFLYFYKGPHFATIVDLTTIGIHEVEDLDSFSNFNVGKGSAFRLLVQYFH